MTSSPGPRRCNTPGCHNPVAHPGHAYCSDCIGTVLRTGRGPELLPTARLVAAAVSDRDRPRVAA